MDVITKGVPHSYKGGQSIALFGTKKDQHKIKFDHNLYYGDFEAYSSDILNRLKETEKSFLSKIEKSCIKMNKVSGSKAKAFLLVKSLSSKKKFLDACKKNEAIIIDKMNKSINFKKQIFEITASRSVLYSSWYPNYGEDEYKQIVIKINEM